MQFLNKFFSLLACIAVLLFSSCGDDSDSSTPLNEPPASFSAGVTDITLTSATVEWSQAIDPDGDAVTYSVTLNGATVASSVAGTSFDLTDLTEDTDYSGTVTANDGNGGSSTANFSFTTNGNQTPGMFTVTVAAITPTSAELNWSESVDPDGNNVTYNIMLAGSEVANGLEALTFALTSLTPDTDYQGRVIASDGQGGESETMFSFTTDSEQTEACPNDNSIDQDDRGCTESPSVSNSYSESVAGDERTITTNGIPSHDFRNQIPNIVSDLNASTKTYTADATPTKAANTTSITDDNGRPKFRTGVATNGVAIDPAPAEPFIFENTETGEYNWDWVMEPNNNMNAVGLDCAIAHVQPDGTYHYHGNMGVYAEQLSSGISTGTAPTQPIQIGWAADGFPILYLYGPNADGSGVELLESSYQLKSGERPGDGVSEPCGEYNGKYTNDYDFVNGSGDLDECNGIDRTVTIGGETFDYFYMITEEFPIISRCLVGTPNNSFRLGGG